MLAKFLSLRENVHCSFSTFFKYKPIYITPLTEREKETCLCIKCQNAHLLLRVVKTYYDLKNLMKYSPVTQCIKNDPKKDVKNFPECDDTKEIIYVFEAKVESSTKNGKTAEHVLLKRQELRFCGKAITEKSHLSPSQI